MHAAFETVYLELLPCAMGVERKKRLSGKWVVLGVFFSHKTARLGIAGESVHRQDASRMLAGTSIGYCSASWDIDRAKIMTDNHNYYI